MKGLTRRRLVLFPSLLTVLFFPSFLLSQSQITTGVIQGVVADESGGLLPGAKVTLVHSDTGFKRELVSDAGGRFTALLMPLGAYQITAEQTGFATLVREGVTLTVGQTANLILTMKVAGTATRIEVSGEAPQHLARRGLVALPAHLLAEESVVEVAAVHADVVEHASLAGERDLIAVGALDDAHAGRQHRSGT